MERVPDEELEEQARDGRCHHRGTRFTGVGFSLYPTGELKSEAEFREGLLWGPYRRYRRDGRLLAGTTGAGSSGGSPAEVARERTARVRGVLLLRLHPGAHAVGPRGPCDRGFRLGGKRPAIPAAPAVSRGLPADERAHPGSAQLADPRWVGAEHGRVSRSGSDILTARTPRWSRPRRDPVFSEPLPLIAAALLSVAVP